MGKLLTVVKHEYRKRVATWAFVISTILGPVLLVGLPLIPIFLTTLDLSETNRLSIVDPSGRLYERVRKSILEKQGTRGPLARRESAVYEIEQAPLSGSLEETKQVLSRRIRRGELDSFIVIPPDVLESGKIEHYGRNVEDIASNLLLDEYLSRALVDERMEAAHIDPALVRQLTSEVSTSRFKVSEHGEELVTGSRFFAVIGLGLLLMLALLTYGGMILSAVTEEKETRVVEMLFYSVKSFPLMFGKLIGVSLVAFTQYAIWGLLAVSFLVFGAGLFSEIGRPDLPALHIVYFILFFLIGYYIYSTVYAFIGAASTSQEQAQTFAMAATAPLILAFSMVVPVIRNPDSWFAFWTSMFPFFSPIAMPVRIVTQPPPFWEIALSLFIGVSSTVVLVWMAARVYRTGMLMYGKRVTIPEIWRWVRQP